MTTKTFISAIQIFNFEYIFETKYNQYNTISNKIIVS